MYLTQPLHRAIQQYPDRIATIDGHRHRTFREHVDRIARLAGGLRSIGVRSGDRVAMYSENSDCFLEYLMAVPWADAVLVPVNIRWSAQEIVDSLIDAEVEVLLVDDRYAEAVADLQELCPPLRHVIHTGRPAIGVANWIDYEELIADATPVPDARRGGDSLAALFYTGGTTGKSKGVMLSHANLMTSAMGSAVAGFWATPGGRFLHSAPMFHLADLSMWAAHSLGGSTHVIVPSFEPRRVLRAVEEHRITDLFLVPTMIQMLIEHPGFGEYDLSSLRRFCYGASPIPPHVLDRTLSLLPDVELAQAYGMTELSPVATLLGPEDHRSDTARRYSAGRAAPHSEIRVVDDAGDDVAPGEIGEIVSRGGHVMLGYWNRPDATAAALRDGWMRTGDAGYLDEDGYLFVIDRIKDMIVSGGENVYSAEVEKALHQHPAVSACAVIGLPDPTYGERVHAVVTLRAGRTVTREELRAHVKTLIAGYKAPRTVEFIDALPLTGAGKILKRELRRRHLDQETRPS
ncbi:long-chain fatty acid--CoA ligase [Nocardia sp. NBC_00508]|uniref:acyl-CoA synthetase n=1 Tax=Nocardia sp. NBC_00508 TaxID=2975992 RepID=UPI002E81A127|nr:long-chain fatty acid--CoA ligase [Nocardia sp. NBC_00508]WUD67104.1 long-chain fatty acid--CoA ligase [Nocardia sp. NBC_00508]